MGVVISAPIAFRSVDDAVLHARRVRGRLSDRREIVV
jgi:hypothetical protein